MLKARRFDDRPEAGFTLVEVMVAFVIGSIVILALLTALGVIFKATPEASARLETNAEAQLVAAAWSKDVQSVLPGGVNTSTICVALPPVGSTQAEVDREYEVQATLVTFSWQNSGSVGPSRRTATWYVTGTGSDMKLKRTECSTTASGVDVETDVLASRFAVKEAAQPFNLVYGQSPYSDGGTGYKDFCPTDSDRVARSCTLTINAAYRYSITATRRVPDLSGNKVDSVPPAPPGLVAVGRNTYITVGFQASPTTPYQSPVEEYLVEFRPGSCAAAPTQTVSVTPAANAASFSARTPDGSLQNNTSYCVMAKARNAVGTGPSSETFATPVPGPPEPPVNLTVTPADGKLTVTWTKPNDGGSSILDYRLSLRVAATGELVSEVSYPYVAPGSVTAEFADPTVKNYVGYEVLVTARSAIGVGDTAEGFGMPHGAEVLFVSTTGDDAAAGGCGSYRFPCRTGAQAMVRAGQVSGITTVAFGAGEFAPFTIANGISVQGGFSATLLGNQRTTPRAPLCTATEPQNCTVIRSQDVTTPLSFSGSATREMTVTDVWAAFDASAGAGGTAISITNSGSRIVLDGVRAVGKGGPATQDATGLLVSGVGQARIVGSDIDSGDTRADSGQSAYGVRAVAGAKVTIDDSTVVARNGADGADGGVGADGVNGDPGTMGTTGASSAWYSETSCTTHYTNGNGLEVQGGLSGGSGADRGGFGGRGGCDANWGTTGGTGHAGFTDLPTPSGANGGGDGGEPEEVLGCNGAIDNSGGGEGGNGGARGAVAAGGVGGVVSPLSMSSFPRGDGGNGGNAGTGAGGGGGGGGGGGESCPVANADVGASGGGGGGGGQGGTGGLGGLGGGGSFAVYSHGTSGNVTTITATDSSFTAGDGGDGGDGGRGGNGGNGGKGGNGGQGADDGSSGGGGGGGGGAGAPGAGGGAGAGGPSIAAARGTNSTHSLGNSTFDNGTSGGPGTPGSAGNPGTGGPKGDKGTRQSGSKNSDGGDGGVGYDWTTGGSPGQSGGTGGTPGAGCPAGDGSNCSAAISEVILQSVGAATPNIVGPSAEYCVYAVVDGGTATKEARADVSAITTGESNQLMSAGSWPPINGTTFTHRYCAVAKDAFNAAAAAYVIYVHDIVTVSKSGATQVVTDLPPTLASPALRAASDSALVGDRYTKVKQPWFDGTGAVANALVYLYRDGNEVGSATAAADGSYQIKPTVDVSDGTWGFTVRQANSSGARSAPSTAVDVTVDTHAEPIALAATLATASDSGPYGEPVASSYYSDHVTRVLAPVFEGTGAEAGATVTAYVGGRAIGSTVADGPAASTPGKYSVPTESFVVSPLAGLADGSHQIWLSQTDRAGNVWSDSVAAPKRTVRIDRSGPASSDNRSTVIRAGWTKHNPVSIGWTCTASGEAAGFRGMYSTNGTEPNPTAIGSGTTVGGSANLAMPNSALDLRYRCEDVAGNLSSPGTVTGNVQLDQVAPTAAVGLSQGMQYSSSGVLYDYNRGTTPTTPEAEVSWGGQLPGTATDASSGLHKVELTLRHVDTGKYCLADGVCNSDEPQWISATVAGNNWSRAWPSSTFTRGGSYEIVGRSEDVAMNVTTSTQRLVHIDFNKAESVFVSAASGSVAYDGLCAFVSGSCGPKPSVTAALAVAAATAGTRPYIVVAGGTYNESLTTTAGITPVVRGGYSAAGLRGAIGANTATLGTNGLGVFANGTGGVRLEQMTVVSGTPRLSKHLGTVANTKPGIASTTGVPTELASLLGSRSDMFSVRWTYTWTQAAAVAGFKTRVCTDDGGRLYLTKITGGGGRDKIFDQWVDQGVPVPCPESRPVDLQAGAQYKLEFEMYEHGGGAAASLEPVVPATALWPTTNGWTADVYSDYGASAYGIRGLNGGTVTLLNSAVSASAGNVGQPGANGNGGNPGGGLAGGAGGEGGKGGAFRNLFLGGCRNPNENGAPGGGGDPGSGASPSNGGTGAPQTTCGNNGANGSDGTAGTSGSAGSPGVTTFATQFDVSWQSSGGGTGGAGVGGGGGGGGAGGAGGAYVGTNQSGESGQGSNGGAGGAGGGSAGAGGGGGGGTGGVGGAAGAGGQSGGASFGIYAWDTAVTVSGSQIASGAGGSGGAGGASTAGVSGSNGGGGADSGSAYDGGNGGKGGTGGRGGGGGGGAGGPSIAVYLSTGNVSGTGTFTKGVGGNGGNGGSGGAGGNSGFNGDPGPACTTYYLVGGCAA